MAGWISRLVRTIEIASGVNNELKNKLGIDCKQVIANAARDTFESIVAEKRTLDEWANMVINSVDEIIDETIKNEDVNYAAGKLIFSLDKNTRAGSPKVLILYELYFIDANGNYIKKSAKSDVNQDNFTQDAIEEIKENGKVSYEVEGR